MAKRQRGRPPLKDEDRKSEPVGIRLTKALREQLDEARKQADGERSLSKEIEIRLRQSFEMEDTIRKRFGDAETYWLLQMMAIGISMVQGKYRPQDAGDYASHWFKDRYTFDQVKLMMNRILDHFKPKGRMKLPKHYPPLKQDIQNKGAHIALYILGSLESLRNFPNEADVPVEYFSAMMPLGVWLKGSPIEGLWKDQRDTKLRIERHVAKMRKGK